MGYEYQYSGHMKREKTKSILTDRPGGSSTVGHNKPGVSAPPPAPPAPPLPLPHSTARTTGEPPENHRRTTGEPPENHRRTTGEPPENHRRTGLHSSHISYLKKIEIKSASPCVNTVVMTTMCR
ncbi:hypothetical protein NHX12_010070 [Muraenolepis orangiensis]|uniref:Uncharacterized protein n=1 Tax=Muraenolepis orangiensis TaxID=630683 RepID=A0A9Q0I822_9TELE|nr:hypothetical protein NHX12_010070 [Muraenolepis orangiensis]